MRTLVIGASSFIGSALMERLSSEWETLGTCFRFNDRRLAQLDIRDISAVRKIIHSVTPDVILHLAALANPDTCEQDRLLARAINVDGTKNVAKVAAEIGAKIVFFSTDYVFDGTHPPYKEDSPVNPLNYYGRTKAEAERVVKALSKNHVIVRLPIVYGCDSRAGGCIKPAFVWETIRDLRQRKQITLDCQQIRYPVLVDDVVAAIFQLVTTGFQGSAHLPGPEAVTKYEWGLMIAQVFRLPETLIIPAITQSIARRPQNVKMLSTSVEIQKPSFRKIREGLQEMKKQRKCAILVT